MAVRAWTQPGPWWSSRNRLPENGAARTSWHASGIATASGVLGRTFTDLATSAPLTRYATATRMSEPQTSPDASAAVPVDDATSFGRQLVALAAPMQAFLHTLCRGGAVTGASVDDLVQEVMARALRSRTTFAADKGTLHAWLSRITFRVYLDHRQAPATSPTLAEEPATCAPGPLAQAAAREQLHRLLGRLSSRERGLLLRFHRDGRSVAELAAADAVPTGTIKSLLHRARARLWAAFLHGEQP